MSVGYDTDRILSATFSSLRKTRVDGKQVTRDDVEDVWDVMGQYLGHSLEQGKSIQIAKFGTFVAGSNKAEEPVLVLGQDFLKSLGARQRQGGLPRVVGATKFNFLGMSRFGKVSKDLCRKVVEGVFWNLSAAIAKNPGLVTLEFTSVGEFECKNKVCQFFFGEEEEVAGDDDEEDRLEEEKSALSEEEKEEYEIVKRPTPSAREIVNQRKQSRRVIPPSLERLKEKLKQRGANGIHGLGRMLKIMDESGDGQLDKQEFKYGLQDYGIVINVAELDELFTFLDKDRSGKLSLDELLVALQGSINKRRLGLIKTAFRRLDTTGDGVVTIEDLEQNYNAKFDPDVQAGRKSEADALRAFLKQFDTIDEDGIVTEEEFIEYYKSVSASIDEDKDDYFELMIRNAWHISGGKGQYENTSNRRVLVTLKDGTQRVEEIKDDLYVDKNDQQEMKRRLKQAGVDAQGELGMTYGTDQTSKPKSGKRGPSRLTKQGADPFANANGGGDESLPDFGDASTAQGVAKKQPEQAKPNPMEKLGKLIQAKRLSVDDFLLKIGANRVFGSASIDIAQFVRGVTRFDPSISKKEAEEIARIADSDQNGTIDVPELCAHLKGASAVDRIKAALAKRGGMNGIASISRTLRIMDDNGDRSLNRRELAEGFQNYGVKLTSGDIEDLFAFFDNDRNGKISIDEFLLGLRGDLNERRKDLVLKAFRLLDRTGDGVVTVEDLESVYDPTHHPDFKEGKKTKAQVLREFLDNFDEGEKDGVVTEDEFLDYYRSISASIDGDDYFELMIRNAWHISGGKGQYENTTNKRVLVTNADGTQSVQEVKDDLFVDTADKEEVRRRLKLAKDAKIDSYFSNDATSKATRKNPPASLGQRRRAAAATKKTIPQKLGPEKTSFAWGASGGDESIPMMEEEEREISSSARGSGPRPAAMAQSPTKKSSTRRGFAAKRNEQVQQQVRKQPVSYGSRREPEILKRFRERVIQRGGTNGINTLARVLKIMDDNGDKTLDPSELKYGLQDYGVQCTPNEVKELFSYLDRDNSGKISFDEFLVGLRGPVNERRVALIDIAFKRLDRTKDGYVTVEDLEMTYDPSFNPEVKSGKITKAEALREFLNQFDTIQKDGIVTFEEFVEYYKNVSASIDSDDYFELMMRNAWHISGGKGQMANTSNRRVLVTKSDGSQSVEEIQDDLWVDKNDEKEMKTRLAKRGIQAQGKLGLSYGTDKTSKARNPAARPNLSSTSKQTSSILAWEDEADKRGLTIDQLNDKVQRSRERERKIRVGAASRVQALARARLAKKKVSIEKNKATTQTRLSREIQQEEKLSARGKIYRPASSTWY